MTEGDWIWVYNNGNDCVEHVQFGHWDGSSTVFFYTKEYEAPGELKSNPHELKSEAIKEQFERYHTDKTRLNNKIDQAAKKYTEAFFEELDKS